ncbi:hypothetical protein M569_00700, partial [Genlisea aurea]
PRLPLSIRIAYFFVRITTDFSLRRDGTVNRLLANFFQHAVSNMLTTTKPRAGVRTADIVVDVSRNLWFRLFVPTHVADRRIPVVVFFHGGGFVFMSADLKHYDNVCRRFATEIGAVVVSVNYRLAPEHRYPSPYEDGCDVLRFLDQNKHLLPENADLSRCFLAGDSSGGNISHHVAKRWCESAAESSSRVIGVVAIQPLFNGKIPSKSEVELESVDVIISFERTNWFLKAFLPSDSDDFDHEAINVSGPNAADVSKLDFPTTMVVISEFDSLKDWQRKYYEWLKDSGKEAVLVEYPNMVHGFYIFPELPESTHLINRIKDFVTDQCAKATK